MLFGSTMLEVAIGVIFVYLLVSLLCSALNELIEAWLKYRARYLERGIRRLLADPGLAERFFEHPLVRPLGERPSYIPARTFSLALWNIASAGAARVGEVDAGVTQNVAAIRRLVGDLDDAQYGHLKTTLLTLMDEAGNDLGKARAAIEAWYDDAMDRVSGWYKRRTHLILIVIGLLASFLLNIDTIQITKALLYNDTLRKSVADSAATYVNANPAPAPGAAPAPEQDPEQQAAEAQKRIDNVRNQLNQLGLPIGWPTAPDRLDPKYKDPDTGVFVDKQFNADVRAYQTDPRRFPSDGYGIFLKLLGLVLTGLAVSQGAPFWFDLLNKFIVIRSTVKPQEKSQPQPSKDKPAPETEEEQRPPDGE